MAATWPISSLKQFRTLIRKRGLQRFGLTSGDAEETPAKYDDGIVEQKDVLFAFNYLKEIGVQSIHISVCYFGTWIIAKARDKIPANAVIMVSPPAAMMRFNPGRKIPGLKLAVTGSRD